MSMKIVGVTNSSGNYQGNDYDNIILHCTEPFNNEKSTGLRTESFKIKHSIMAEIFGKSLTSKELAAFVGQEANFFYDKFNHVNLVQLVQRETAK